MTNLEVLKSKAIGYPIEENTYLGILIDRVVDAAAEYKGKSKAMELAKADLYVTLLTAANITEGGFQLSLTDKTNFANVASGIYDFYGEPNPFKKATTQIKARRMW